MGGRLGLTGGIGSGKSTVANLLRIRGAFIIDADAISRACTAPQGAAMPAIAHAFGPDVIDANGGLDREIMRQRVFNDATARSRLEQIVHPVVGQQIAQQAHLAETAGAQLLVFDIPLLVESAHWRQSLNHILVVDCRIETQISRVMQRSQLTVADVEKIIAVQASRSARLHSADSVLFNDDCSIASLECKVLQIATQFGLSFRASENSA
jgi:dephospho-CoA kinase